MALIDFTSDLPRRGRPAVLDYASLKAPYFILASLAASLLVIGTAFLIEGQTAIGWRLAAENIQRFSFFFFLPVFVVVPLARLFPALGLRPVALDRHKLVLAFATAFAVSLVCLIAPYQADSLSTLLHRVPATTFAYVLFGLGALLVMLAGAHDGAARYLGRWFVRLMDRCALIYFWALFGFAAVDHLMGPHRPDGFFGFSLILLVAALLIRFAASFAEMRKAALA